MSAWFLRPVPLSIDSMEVIASYGLRKSERHAAARDCFTSAGFPKCAYMIAAAARTVVVCFVILMPTTPYDAQQRSRRLVEARDRRCCTSPPLTGELVDVDAYGVDLAGQSQHVAIDQLRRGRAVEMIDGGPDRSRLGETVAIGHTGELCSFSFGEPDSHPRAARLTPRDPTVTTPLSLIELVRCGDLRLDWLTLIARLILSRAGPWYRQSASRRSV